MLMQADADRAEKFPNLLSPVRLKSLMVGIMNHFGSNCDTS